MTGLRTTSTGWVSSFLLSQIPGRVIDRRLLETVCYLNGGICASGAGKIRRYCLPCSR
jgi:hypothetical protein